MDPEYELMISIFQGQLEIQPLSVKLKGSVSLQYLYNYILQVYSQQIKNKVYKEWISKVNGLGKFAYTDGQTISNIFGSMLKGHFTIYTERDQVPKDSELDIFQTDDDKLFYINFLLVDGSNGVKSQLEYECKPSLLFFDAINALYNFQSLTKDKATFQFEKDGKSLIFNEKTTFRQLNIVSNTTLHVKTRWCGGYYCGDSNLQSQFYQPLH